MGYYIDLENISIDKYKSILKTTDLLPSWKILETDIDKNLDSIKTQGVRNLHGLLEALKNKEKLQEFSKQSGLSVKYLEVLRRVVNGYRPKPNRIKDLIDMPDAIVQKLEVLGIKNTLKLYGEILTTERRKALSLMYW